LRKAGWTIFVLILLVIALGVVQIVRSVPPQTTAITGPHSVSVPGTSSLPWPATGSAAVAIGKSGAVRVHGSETPEPIASLAKMMTAYIVLKDHPLLGGEAGPSIPITAADVTTWKRDVANSDSVLQVATGESLTEQQALEALLVASADNVADILAQWDSGSISSFVAKMNATAHSLGMDHTHYADPSGLDTTTVSTASDQLIIARTDMAIPAFADIVAMPDATFPLAGTVQNFNYDVGHDGIIGVKTGSDTTAGGCWAFAADRTIGTVKRVVYGVVLGIPGTSAGLVEPALAAGEALANAIPGTVRSMTVVPAGTVVGYVRAPWRSTPVPITTVHAIDGLVDNGTSVRFHVAVSRPSGRTVSKGERLGTLSTNDVTKTSTPKSATTTPIVAETSGSGPTLTWRLTRG